jgi:uncharacterized membrane protein YeaQ/YmgE (transglycosylase-associated protein family)
VGVVGSFVGGTILTLLVTGSLDVSASGLIGSILGALIVLWAWRQWGGRRATV